MNTARLTSRGVVSSGCAELDARLARKGLGRGTLVESLGAGEGAGATFLALSAVKHTLADGGALVIIDPREAFYPPAVLPGGLTPDRMVIVRPETQRDALWACERALRSSGVAAVLSWPEYLTPLSFRRLQLAAEEGGALGVLIRSARVLNEPSWAETRWLVSPVASEAGRRRFFVNVLRGQNRKDGALLLEADDEGALRMVPGLADSTAQRSERRA